MLTCRDVISANSWRRAYPDHSGPASRPGGPTTRARQADHSGRPLRPTTRARRADHSGQAGRPLGPTTRARRADHSGRPLGPGGPTTRARRARQDLTICIDTGDGNDGDDGEALIIPTHHHPSTWSVLMVVFTLACYAQIPQPNQRIPQGYLSPDQTDRQTDRQIIQRHPDRPEDKPDHDTRVAASSSLVVLYCRLDVTR